LPYEEAKQFVQSQLITSRAKYEEWHSVNNPKVVPKYPNRTYEKDWTSWNDFLGTDNKFRSGQDALSRYRSLRSHDQAALWVHSLGLNTQDEWLSYCKDNPIPEDIPLRPDLTYKDWKGWKFWLGKAQADTIELAQKVSQTRMLYVVHEREYPSNVVTLGTDMPDVQALKAAWERTQFDVLKLYWFSDENLKRLTDTINAMTTPYLGDDRHRIVPNVNELLWQLDNFLDTIRLN
jgi:hypothetical protein